MAIVIQTRPKEYQIAGSGGDLHVQANRARHTPLVGVDNAWEGEFDASGNFRTGCRLSGDQIHQGRHIRLEPGYYQIQRVQLCRNHK